MKKNAILLAVLTGFAFAMFTGCSGFKTKPTDHPKYNVESVSHSNKFFIKSVNISHNKEYTEISGKIKYNNTLLKPFKGHVDIAVFSPEGELTHSSSVFYTPGYRYTRLKSNAHKGSSFSARLPGKIQEGATIYVASHTYDHQIEKEIDCSDNPVIRNFIKKMPKEKD